MNCRWRHDKHLCRYTELQHVQFGTAGNMQFVQIYRTAARTARHSAYCTVLAICSLYETNWQVDFIIKSTLSLRCNPSKVEVSGQLHAPADLPLWIESVWAQGWLWRFGEDKSLATFGNMTTKSALCGCSKSREWLGTVKWGCCEAAGWAVKQRSSRYVQEYGTVLQLGMLTVSCINVITFWFQLLCILTMCWFIDALVAHTHTHTYTYTYSAIPCDAEPLMWYH